MTSDEDAELDLECLFCVVGVMVVLILKEAQAAGADTNVNKDVVGRLEDTLMPETCVDA